MKRENYKTLLTNPFFCAIIKTSLRNREAISDIASLFDGADPDVCLSKPYLCDIRSVYNEAIGKVLWNDCGRSVLKKYKWERKTKIRYGAKRNFRALFD